MYAKLQYFCVILTVIGSLTDASLITSQSKGSKLGSRIVGGLSAYNVDVPYIVGLLNYGIHFCGGAIINERTVITAAHCLISTRPSIMRVHLGTKTKTLREGYLITVDAIYPHEKWNLDDMDHDIGLVRLSRSLRFSHNVQPIRLPNSNDVLYDGTYGMIAGWGLTSSDGSTTKMLRYARVPIVNQEICNQLLNDLITERMFCAGYLQGGIDACQMDSGGPFVIENKLYGIVSWGIGCALPNKPGVYTRVTSLLPWVEEIMKNKFNERLEYLS